MKMVKKDYYLIRGRTKSDKWVGVSCWTTQELTIAAFKKKYPRFCGTAHLSVIECEVCEENGIVIESIHGNHTSIFEFRSIKELVSKSMQSEG
jgi:hypothetical protein